MTDNFYLALAAILLFPIIPAFVLYKFLPPSRTNVSGPFKGLSVRMTGAFASYFLLVLVGIGLQYTIMNNEQKKQLLALNEQLVKKDSAITLIQKQYDEATLPPVDWHIRGKLLNDEQQNIRVWFDTRTVTQNDNGVFELSQISHRNLPARPPYWINFYSETLGFKQINLDTEFENPDLDAYQIQFDSISHLITIRKPIIIDSKKKADTAAVASYLDAHPELKRQVEVMDPVLINRADSVKKEIQADKMKYKRLQSLRLQKMTIPLKPN